MSLSSISYYLQPILWTVFEAAALDSSSATSFLTKRSPFALRLRLSGPLLQQTEAAVDLPPTRDELPQRQTASAARAAAAPVLLLLLLLQAL